MSTYDERARALAKKMLAMKDSDGKGQAVTITHNSSGAYDPASSAVTVTTTTQFGSGLIREYNLRQIDGTLVQIGDRALRLSPYTVDGVILDPAPAIDDLVTLSTGETYTIKAVSPMSPAGLAIFYDCNIRGAA